MFRKKRELFRTPVKSESVILGDGTKDRSNDDRNTGQNQKDALCYFRFPFGGLLCVPGRTAATGTEGSIICQRFATF